MTRSLTALALLLAVAAPALAHHSFDAEYDSNKVANISGFVTKVDWQNPHAFVYIDVAPDNDAKGGVKSFRVEMGPPYALVRGGWKKESVKIGDTVSISNGALGKDPSLNWVGAVPNTKLVLPSGQEMGLR